ncbi:hypothetical protein CSUI_007185, partial [Cystoisospora suis]
MDGHRDAKGGDGLDRSKKHQDRKSREDPVGRESAKEDGEEEEGIQAGGLLQGFPSRVFSRILVPSKTGKPKGEAKGEESSPGDKRDSTSSDPPWKDSLHPKDLSVGQERSGKVPHPKSSGGRSPGGVTTPAPPRSANSPRLPDADQEISKDEKIFMNSEEPSSPLPVQPPSPSLLLLQQEKPRSPSFQPSSEPFSRRWSSCGHSATNERNATEMSLLLHDGSDRHEEEKGSFSLSLRRSSLSSEKSNTPTSSRRRNRGGSVSRRSRRESIRIENTAIHGDPAPSSVSADSHGNQHSHDLDEALTGASFPYPVSLPSSPTVTSPNGEGPPSNDPMSRNPTTPPTPHFLNSPSSPSPSSSSSSSSVEEFPVCHAPVSPRRHSDLHLSPENRPAEGDCDQEIDPPPEDLAASPHHGARSQAGDGSSKGRSRRVGIGNEALDHSARVEEGDNGSFMPFTTRHREFSRWRWVPSGLHIPTSIPISQPLRETRNAGEGPSGSSSANAALGASTVMKKLFTTAGGGSGAAPPSPSPPDYRRLCTNLWDDEGL